MAVLFFRPEWDPGVTERYRFSTDVMQSASGTEQRVKLRGTPNRVFGMTLVVPTAEQLRKLEAVLAATHSGLVDVPLWWDARIITNTVSIGGTSLTVDTTNTEFTNGNRCLISKDDDTWEVVTLSGVAAGTLTVSATTKAWSPNTAYAVPLLPAYWSREVAHSRLNRSLGRINLQLRTP